MNHVKLVRTTLLMYIIAFLLAVLLLGPSKARAGEPDMKKVCYVVAEMTAKVCYRTGLPATTNKEAKLFLKGMCNAAGDEANETCLSGEATKKFGSLPTCDGVSLFTASAIMKGGAKTVSSLGLKPGATLNKLTGFVSELAKATASRTYDECTEEMKKVAPPKPAKPPDNWFDV
jgi:hypothetical protein